MKIEGFATQFLSWIWKIENIFLLEGLGCEVWAGLKRGGKQLVNSCTLSYVLIH